MGKYFNVLSTTSSVLEFATVATTSHWRYDRQERHNKIMTNIGDGKLIQAFLVDTGHTNGMEVHNVFDNGVVLIQNYRTNLVVTEIVARAPQIRRYWEGVGLRYGVEVVRACNKAKMHEANGWNHW